MSMKPFWGLDTLLLSIYLFLNPGVTSQQLDGHRFYIAWQS